MNPFTYIFNFLNLPSLRQYLMPECLVQHARHHRVRAGDTLREEPDRLVDMPEESIESCDDTGLLGERRERDLDFFQISFTYLCKSC